MFVISTSIPFNVKNIVPAPSSIILFIHFHVNNIKQAKIEYNTVKPSIHFWLLTLHNEPLVASKIASFTTIIGYIVVADSMAYLTRLFKKS
ncbi:MAG: hypothetical protein M3044_04080 [Thermoproteota archaeon]|nr:hypothetical protein [Thermoproteota archaeon]